MSISVPSDGAGTIPAALCGFAASPEGVALATDYLRLLERVDVAFASHTQGDPARTVCKPGCCDCCTGVFEITILDALLLAVALNQQALPPAVEGAAADLSREVARRGWPFPHLFEQYPDAHDLDALDAVACPLCDEAGLCRLYAMRPSVCRLQGLVFADPKGDLLLEDDCPRRDTTPPPALLDLHGYYNEEDVLYRRLRAQLPVPGDAPMDGYDTLVTGVLMWFYGRNGGQTE